MATATRERARDLGHQGLQGWRKRLADAAAPRVARRTPLSESDVRAAIGLLFLVLAARYLTVALKRALADRSA
jgi:hypothetical protein